MPRGYRSEYPGTFRSSKNRWAMKVWIDGELHYLGTMEDRAAAADYVRLVESRYPNRLRRAHGSLYYSRKKSRWIARGPQPARAPIGRFMTRWEGERVLRRLGLRSLLALAALLPIPAQAQVTIAVDPPQLSIVANVPCTATPGTQIAWFKTDNNPYPGPIPWLITGDASGTSFALGYGTNHEIYLQVSATGIAASLCNTSFILSLTPAPCASSLTLDFTDPCNAVAAVL